MKTFPHRHSATVPCVMEERLWLRVKTTAAALTTSRHQTMTHFALSARHRTPDSTTVHNITRNTLVYYAAQQQSIPGH